MRKGIRHWLRWTAPAMLLVGWLLPVGCATPEEPSDVTLDELEARMVQAMDPGKNYRNAYSYFQRQNIEEKRFFSANHYLVEVRFQRPDKFKFTVFEENTPQSAIISKGGQAWTIDYVNGVISELTGRELAKVKTMLALGHPDNDYDQLFEKVDLSIVKLPDDDAEYYKLVCDTGITDQKPIIIYVDRARALPKRMELDFKAGDIEVHYVNDIVEYQTFDEVKIPSLSRITENDREYTSRVVGYVLNPKFKNDEFDVPEFDPVLMEVKRQRLKNR
ncbi:hypothetical protein SDC9_98511 [bioreactor metagenome]|uniref:Outer membrane lipoprotein-sorting protein n=1 Tax=bioreactor metagenome TaxID=1076179 RepID=A0A645AF25_9ZZZZ